MRVPDDPKKRSQARSYLRKYLLFCIDTKVSPFPLSLMQLMRFAVWLPRNGIKSGWSGVKNYTGAVVRYNQIHGNKDPRESDKELWDLLRDRFKSHVQVVQSQSKKLPIRQSQVQALALRAIQLGTPTATADMACDALLNFSALRIGHCSPDSGSDMRHVLHWEDIYFYPSLKDCTAIYLHLDSTKSRHVKELKPTWTAVGRVTSIPLVCPIRWMIRHFLCNYSGRPTDPVFCVPGTSSPLIRQRYTARLRDRLAHSASEFLPDFQLDVESYSGISWRKAGISALSRQAAHERLHIVQVADFADHKDIKTSRSYIADSLGDRAAYSDLIATAGAADSLDELFAAPWDDA
eukprot:SAG31_NODE_1828_length_7159_cov_58.418980_7_plen_349_part_00